MRVPALPCSAVCIDGSWWALRYRPDQFAFAGFGGSAPHPFTISKAPGKDGSIRMTVARLGDFTTRSSRSLAVGTGVRIECP